MASSFAALATTIHLALAALRHHRSAPGGALYLALIPSIGFAAVPWFWPTVEVLAGTLLIHLAWYTLSGRLLPQAKARPEAPRPVEPALATPVPAAHRSRAERRPQGFVQTPVLAVIDETPDIRTFRLGRPDGFGFQAGQFLAVRVKADGREHVRCYSISSAPEATGALDISVRRQGLVSNLLHASLAPGSLLSVKAPAGAFVYPDNDDRPLLLIAGGVGITPLMSMLRHAALVEPARPIVLVYSARTRRDFAFDDELTTFRRRLPSLTVTLAVSRGPAGSDAHAGRVSESLLRAVVPDLPSSIALMCGPTPMIDEMRVMLGRLGLPPDRIRAEVFEAAVAASAGRSPAGVAGSDANLGADAGHTVTFAKSGRRTQATPSQSLLEIAETCGAQIESLCRAGVCGTCRTRVLEGTVDCASDLLDDDDRAGGFVLACVSNTRSDCHIDA